jgi:hypothetical protein
MNQTRMELNHSRLIIGLFLTSASAEVRTTLIILLVDRINESSASLSLRWGMLIANTLFALHKKMRFRPT